MNVYVLNRRTLIFKSSSKEPVDVLVVPGRDQIQVVRNIAGAVDVNVADLSKTAKANQPQLARVRIGMKYIYGYLVEEITELNQSVRVWLAEDFVDPASKAFFFIFSPTVVIHGIRETNDEGHISWRVAKLPIQGDPYTDLLNAVSDYVISNSTEGLVVAVYNQVDLYNRLQNDLASYSVFPVPFSKLKPAFNVKPLYRHYDFTLIYATLVLFCAIAVMASVGYLIFTLLSKKDVERQIQQVQDEIHSVQINQKIGQIRDPQAVLAAMDKPTDIPPSSVIQATSDVGKEFGTVGGIDFQPTILASGQPTPATEKVRVRIAQLKDILLVDQQRTALEAMQNRSWIRSVRRGGTVGESGDLDVEIQVGEIVPPTVENPQPEMISPSTPVALMGSPSPTEASGQMARESAAAPNIVSPVTKILPDMKEVSQSTGGTVPQQVSGQKIPSVSVSLGGSQHEGASK